ncbi:MAG TPA: ATP-binding protein [Candidatus Limnocylindrales bacterium]|nr:ATP-binding protein [Candidatus Limnocylindrales bacterium]
MDPLVVIPIGGLALALFAALVVMRRRADEIDGLRAALGDRAVPADTAGPSTVDAASPPLLDLLPVGLIEFDVSGRVAAANERAHLLLDVAPGRLIGRSVVETFLDARLEASLAGLDPGPALSADLRTGDGEPRQLAVRATRRASGDLVIVLEDETELRRLRQIRTEFIDNLSHELRTPLSTVSLLAETLARDAERADVPARMRERIAKVEVETGHLVQMVSELLDLARIEGGSQLRLHDDVDLGRLAEASAERLRLFADRQGVTIAVEVQPGMPTIRGDEERLEQVFINLVHNAVKFSADGGEVRVAVRREGDAARASVTDHGIGIAKADRARVFERFYKVDRARVRGGGTGLGLSIARHVVRGHGGRIWVDSEEGRGSSFHVELPLRPDPQLLPAPDARPEPASPVERREANRLPTGESTPAIP